MPNYALKYGTSEVARMLQVDRDVVKTWAFHFSDYLTPEANPPKGKDRQFSLTDIRVFAYVSFYWEESPDFENIRYGLNANNHFEDIYNDFIIEATPLFREMPEDIDETWKGIVFGGEFVVVEDIFSLADNYKLAGDKLVDIAYENDEEKEFFCPAIYNYRHASELYLKAIVGEKKSHDLLDLLNELKNLLKAEFNAVAPQWFDNVIVAFNDFDPYGTAFRYGDLKAGDYMFVDMLHVKRLMSLVSEAFKRIREERSKKFSIL